MAEGPGAWNLTRDLLGDEVGLSFAAELGLLLIAGYLHRKRTYTKPSLTHSALLIQGRRDIHAHKSCLVFL